MAAVGVTICLFVVTMEMKTLYSDGFQRLLGCTAYWWVHAIDYWQGENLKCGKHGLAQSLTEAQSHDEGRVEEV